jgi:hypothetical protein
VALQLLVWVEVLRVVRHHSLQKFLQVVVTVVEENVVRRQWVLVELQRMFQRVVAVVRLMFPLEVVQQQMYQQLAPLRYLLEVGQQRYQRVGLLRYLQAEEHR